MPKMPNPDKPERKRINHENTKIGKHEIFIFRVLAISCFRDKMSFNKMHFSKGGNNERTL